MFAAKATDSAKESEHVLFFQPHAARDEPWGLFLANFVTVFSAKRKQNVCISSGFDSGFDIEETKKRTQMDPRWRRVC
jgi:hypothetical protein